jgi:tRNA(fMet)-specific endonuclease VapC
VVSVVSWGEHRIKTLDRLNEFFIIADIYEETILQKYGEIDAYSQGKRLSNPLPTGLSARNMGKNDLWIAATAHVLGLTILTSDNDFDHLNGVFIEVEKIVFPR